MLGLSFTEILIILTLALLLFGADELPKVARQIGKGLRDIRRAGDDLKSTLEREMVKLEEEPVKPAAPAAAELPAAADAPASGADDPAAARAAARFAAAGHELPTEPEVKPVQPAGEAPPDPEPKA